MSMNLIAVHDQITAKLKELPQEVYETAPPEDKRLLFDPSGLLMPYIVIQHSDMYPVGFGNGITGAKYDNAQAYCLVVCVGPTERSVRQVADLVRDKLTGFSPADGGELRFAGGSTEYATAETKQNRYTTELGFVFPVNTSW